MACECSVRRKRGGGREERCVKVMRGGGEAREGREKGHGGKGEKVVGRGEGAIGSLLDYFFFEYWIIGGCGWAS